MTSSSEYASLVISGIKKMRSGPGSLRRKSSRVERRDRPDAPVSAPLSYALRLCRRLIDLLTERARSISPTKDSPSNMSTPSSVYATRESPRLSRKMQTSREQLPESEPTRENSRLKIASKAGNGPDPVQYVPKAKNQLFEGVDRPTDKPTTSASQSSSSSLGRTGTLSWQQRPTSRGSAGAKGRPLSVVATENNRLRSPRGTPDSEISPDSNMTRNQIAESLGSKDPTWFKQTQDRGLGSPAFRKNQDESKPDSWAAHINLRLPGLSRESTVEPEKEASPRPESVPSPSHSREDSVRGSSSWKQRYASNTNSSVSSSAVPTISSQKLDPPETVAATPVSTEASSFYEPALHGTQSGRASPDRLDRPASPTKGLGGFVQSAMLKRSDSQNKRWNAQADGLSRGNSVVSNRSGYDGSRAVKGTSSPPRDLTRSTLTRDSSPESTMRPGSSRDQTSSAANVAGETLVTSKSVNGRAIRDSDGFVKPDLPEHSRASFKGSGQAKSPLPDHLSASPPASPTKTTDTKRWSPQKASWLESALNKPESPKPVVNASMQPSWMVDLGKAKSQRTSGEQNKALGFKEVTTGGLLRSPPMGAGYKTPGISGLTNRLSSRVGGNGASTPNTLMHTTSLPKPTKSEDLLPEKVRIDSLDEDSQATMERLRPTKSEATRPSDTIPQKPSKPSTLDKLSPPSNKSKPITPPKKEFKVNLKQRQDPSTAKGNEEAEFKNVFGKLKRAETKNYKAPDELKDKILRGKAGLAVTGGPKKTERRDEFKESLLKKKEEMKAGPGLATARKTSAPGKEQHETPETLAKMKSLGRSQSQSETPPLETTDAPKSLDAPNSEERGSPISKPLLPPMVPSKVVPIPKAEPKLNGKLAGRFNPALAGLLSRGPPPTSGGGTPRSTGSLGTDESSRSASIGPGPDNEASLNSGQLTHMTKGRARGPKRKAPKVVVQSDASQSSEPEPLVAEKRPATPSLDAIPDSKRPLQPAAQTEDRGIQKPLSSISNESNQNTLQINATEHEPMTKKPIANPKPNPSMTPAQPQALKKPQLSPEIKARTISTPKVSEVRKPSSQITRTSSPSVAVKPKDVIDKVIDKEVTVPKAPGKDIATKSTFEYQEKISPAQVSPTKEVPKMSVSNAAARWGSSLGKSPQHGQSPKSPIKLPTRFDEEAAHKEAGLSERQPKEPVGLGIRPLPIPPAKLTAHQTSLGLPSPPLRKFSPPTPTKKPALITKRADPNGMLSPEQSTNPLSKPSSSSANALSKYFGELPTPITPIDIDTPKILESRYQTDANKIKTLRKQIWQVTPDGRKISLAPQQEHILYEDNMYLCTHVFGSATGTRTTETYLWYGDDVSSAAVEDAQLFSRKVAKENGGKLIPLRQGKETSEFFQALGGIVITRKNRNGSYVLCGRRHVGQIAFDEVPFLSASLCSGFPYIVSAASGKLYLWKGAGSGADELGCARLIGMDLGVMGEIEEVDEGKEPRAFWDAFPEKRATLDGVKSADFWRKKPLLEKHATRLFSVEVEKRPKSSGTGGFAMWGRRSSTPGPTAESSVANIREISPYAQVDLEGDATFVLDTFFEVFV